MIYTVTMNPSLDYVVRVAGFKPGCLHRTLSEDLFVGGKGINVSVVLKRLGIDSVALGFAAGFTGNQIIQTLDELGISSGLITVSQGISRINIKLKSEENVETEINGRGPVINQDEIEMFFEKLKVLHAGDILVLSGSVPQSIPDAALMYAEICRRVKSQNIRLVVDAEGDLLKNVLPERPFLIKPNRQELEALFHRQLPKEADVCDCARRLQAEGAVNVLVSLGGEGAVLIDEYGTIHRQAAPRGELLNTVGSGDSLVAGFLAQLTLHPLKNGQVNGSDDYEKALRLGVAAGSAGAFSIGLPDKETIRLIYKQLSE
jgi:1-phosphofructokinase